MSTAFAWQHSTRTGIDTATIAVARAGAQLDIVVENGGRVNFAKPLRTEHKGITRSVTLGGAELLHWNVFPLPMTSTPSPHSSPGAAEAPAFYRGSFRSDKPADTFLDLRGWGKGTIWLNGHQLGRFWDIGPQLSLFVPGAWIRRGQNDVVVFDLMTPAQQSIAGTAHALWK
jgi:beta-galactosidase